MDETETTVALDFQSRARPRRGLHWIFSRGPDRDEGCTGFLVVGETEIRVALDLGDGGETETRFLLLFSVVGEIEGPKNATLVSVFGIFETLDYRGAHVCSTAFQTLFEFIIRLIHP